MRSIKWIVMLTFCLLTVTYFAGNSAAADINDNFDDPKALWNLLGDASRVSTDSNTNHAIQLTPAIKNRTGTIWLKQNLTPPFSANFRFQFSNFGDGADGMVVMFNKQKNNDPVLGGGMGFELGKGYGVEFDTWRNEWDSSAGHIALFKNGPQHNLTSYPLLASVNQSNLEDKQWHNVRLETDTDMVRLYMDNELKLNYKGTLDTTHQGFGFSASTGSVFETHLVDDVVISKSPFIKSVGTTVTRVKAGDVIPVAVKFSNPVTVTGTPMLSLNNGRTASYTSGSGSNTLIFSHTVQPGDTFTGFNYANTSGLGLSDGSIAGSDGTANLALPPVSSVDSLSSANIAYMAPSSLTTNEEAAFNIYRGSSKQLTVNALFGDGTQNNVTSSAQYSSANPAIVTVNSSGLLQAIGIGSTDITIKYDGKQLKTHVTVESSVTGIQFDSSSYNLKYDQTTAVQVSIVNANNNTTTPVTTGVVSNDSNVVEVTQDGTLKAVGVGTTTIVATYKPTPSDPPLQATATVHVSPILRFDAEHYDIVSGESVPLSLNAVFSVSRIENVTDIAKYTFDNSSIADMNILDKKLNGLQPGDSLITARYSGWTEPISTSAGIHVTPAPAPKELVLEPEGALIIAEKDDRQLIVKAVYENGSTTVTGSAYYNSKDNNIVTVSDGGLLHAVGHGNTVIDISFGGTTKLANVTALPVITHLEFESPLYSLTYGETTEVLINALLSDQTQAPLISGIAYTTDNTAVVEIDSDGVIKAVGAGSATITASYGAGLQAIAQVNVKPQLHFGAASYSIVMGNSVSTTVYAIRSITETVDVTKDVQFTFDNRSIASIKLDGVLTGLQPGVTVINAVYSGVTVTAAVYVATPVVTTLTIDPPNPITIPMGGSQQLIVKAFYDNGTTQDVTDTAKYSAIDTSKVSVSNRGLLQSVAHGSTVIDVTYGGQAQQAIVTVVPSINGLQFTSSSYTMQYGDPEQTLIVNALYSNSTETPVTSDVTYESDKATVVNFVDGKMRAVAAGSAKIKATYGASWEATASVEVKPQLHFGAASYSIVMGKTVSTTVYAIKSITETVDVTKDVQFTFDNPSIASINLDGVLTGLQPGVTVINAVYSGVTVTAAVYVAAPVVTTLTIDPPNPITIPMGGSQQLIVKALYDNGTTQDVTGSAQYSPADASKVTVINGGLLQAVGHGSTAIDVTYGGISQQISVAVVPSVTGLHLTSSSYTITYDQSGAVNVNAIYSDGVTTPVTSGVNYESDKPSVVNIDSNGVMKAVAAGSAIIKATYGASLEATASVTVKPQLHFAAASYNIVMGKTVSTNVYATNSITETVDVTRIAHFTFDNSSIASIDADGVLSGVQPGITVINAVYSGVTATAGVQVSAAPAPVPVVIELMIDPQGEIKITQGGSQQLIVKALYDNGSTHDVTGSAIYSTGDTTKVSSSGGLLQAVGHGSTLVNITYGGQSKQVSVTVLPSISSLQFKSPSYTMKYGDSQTLLVNAIYSDASEKPVTLGVTYESDNPAVVKIDSNGVMKTVGAGSAKIKAKYGSSLEATASVVVSALLSFDAEYYNIVTGKTVSSNVYLAYSDTKRVSVTTNVYYLFDHPGIATITPPGILSGIKVGQTVVTATYSGFTARAGIHVTAAPISLSDISLNVSTPLALMTGDKFSLAVTANLSDGTKEPVTASASYSSSAKDVVDVNKGEITALAKGIAEITVSYKGKTVLLKVEVKPTPAALKSLTLDKALYALRVGETAAPLLNATYDDSSHPQPISNGYTLTSSNPEVIQVDHDKLIAKKKGSATISTSYNGKQTSAFVLVTEDIVGVEFLLQQINAGVDVNGDDIFDKNDVIIYLTSIPVLYIQ